MAYWKPLHFKFLSKPLNPFMISSLSVLVQYRTYLISSHSAASDTRLTPIHSSVPARSSGGMSL